MFRAFQSSLKKRMRYTQTVSELRTMSPDVAVDLDIDRSQARSMARAAVYGG